MSNFDPSQHLASHRLKGFGPHEGSLSSLRDALDSPARFFEIDTRVDATGRLLVLHDAKLDRVTDAAGWVREFVPGDRPLHFDGEPEEEVPDLDAFLKVFAAGPDNTTLLLDVKDQGTETEHLRLVTEWGLLPRVWFLSWIPEVLGQIHALEPSARLCFCYVPLDRWRRTALFLAGRPRMLQRLQPLATRKGWGDMDEMHIHINDYNFPDPLPEGPMDRASGCPVHLLDGPPAGPLGRVLLESGGGVGLSPPSAATPECIERIREAGLRVFLFNIDTPRRVLDAYETYSPDLIGTDRANLFELDWSKVRIPRWRRRSRDEDPGIVSSNRRAPA